MKDDVFKYHDQLERIALADVEFLKKKDRSYGASWKRSGRSAWFMLKRMMDRLDAMMARPTPVGSFNLQNVSDFAECVEKAKHLTNVTETGAYSVRMHGTPSAWAAHLRYLRDSYLSEDILARLENEAVNGDVLQEMADGTTMAVLRDLRRYALLCEAEIAERVAPSSRTHKVARESRTVPAEDSNRHADRETWTVSGHGYRAQNARELWWTLIAKDSYIPKEVVQSKVIPSDTAKYYVRLANDMFVVNVDICPKSIRSHYSRLQQECNLTEYMALSPWQRLMYKEDAAQEKFCLKPEWKGWSVW